MTNPAWLEEVRERNELGMSCMVSTDAALREARGNVSNLLSLVDELQGKLKEAEGALEKSTGTYSDPMQERERAMMVRQALAKIRGRP